MKMKHLKSLILAASVAHLPTSGSAREVEVPGTTVGMALGLSTGCASGTPLACPVSAVTSVASLLSLLLNKPSTNEGLESSQDQVDSASDSTSGLFKRKKQLEMAKESAKAYLIDGTRTLELDEAFETVRDLIGMPELSDNEIAVVLYAGI